MCRRCWAGDGELVVVGLGMVEQGADGGGRLDRGSVGPVVNARREGVAAVVEHALCELGAVGGGLDAEVAEHRV